MSNMYPGTGRPLYLATYPGGGAALITYPVNAVIGTGSYTESEAIADGLTVQIAANYASAPPVATDIEFSTEPTFTNTTVLTTLPITTDKVNVVSITAKYNGHIRLHNTSTAAIANVLLQKSDSTFG